MNFSDLIARHRAEKSDLYKDRWGDDALFIAWYNDAVSYAFEFRPELFTKNVLVELKCGSMQNVPGADRFLQVTSFADACGNDIADAPRADEKAAAFFGAWVCPSTSATPTSWGFNPKVPDRFTVSPPVGKDVKAYAKVDVAHRPKPLCPADVGADLCLDDSLYPHVMNFISAMMYATEAEASPTSLRLMETYLTLFWKAMGIQYNADMKFYTERAVKNAA